MLKQKVEAALFHGRRYSADVATSYPLPWEEGQGEGIVSRGTKMARKLRQGQTDAERLLWRRLRDRRLKAAKFRRQVPIDGFIADLVCKDARLIIEIDGSQHSDSACDARRTTHLEAAGYTVLRFWNNDVLTNTDGVLERIAEMLAAAGQNRDA